MDLLKRQLSPVLPAAWSAIDEEARRVLGARLAGRRVVDFDGPYGWEHAAVNLGRLDLVRQEPIPDVHVGRRLVQPLIEFRIPIHLEIMELDYIARGARDPELAKVVKAAEKAALMEDGAIFNGYTDGGIVGIIGASSHAAMKLPEGGGDLLPAILAARDAIRDAGVNGPYGVVAGPEAYNTLGLAAPDGYPVEHRVRELLEGPVLRTDAFEGILVLSVRGGDFALTVGQDFAIGYAYQEKHTVELYLTGSFTFRVAEPAAAVLLRP